MTSVGTLTKGSSVADVRFPNSIAFSAQSAIDGRGAEIARPIPPGPKGGVARATLGANNERMSVTLSRRHRVRSRAADAVVDRNSLG